MWKLVRFGAGGVAVLAVALVLTGCIATMIDKSLNSSYIATDLPKPGPADREWHNTLFVADMHSDTMLWDRNFLIREDYGHMDLPRLIEGNVGLQVFAVVTKTPNKGKAPAGSELLPGVYKEECLAHDTINMAGWLQVAQLRPIENWYDLEARAMYQANRLKAFIAESNDRRLTDPDAPYMMLIGSDEDLRDLIQRRAKGERVVGAMLALEGAHWIGKDEPDVGAGIDRLIGEGFRMLAPTHRFNNALGASSEGCNQLEALTESGEAFIRYADKKGLVLDLAHATDTGIARAAELVTGPLIVSHTGIRARCPEGEGCVYERNLADAEVQAVAKTGGFVAIGYWPEAVGQGMAGIIAAFNAAKTALSKPAFVSEMTALHGNYDPMDHIALGSDYDGAVKVPFDTSRLELVNTALRQAGYSDEAIVKIAGVNACRVFAERLSGGDTGKADEICNPLLEAAIGGKPNG